MTTMIRMLLLGVGAAGLFGGPYIVYLSVYKPGTFPRPKQALWQGIVAFVVGVGLLGILFFAYRP